MNLNRWSLILAALLIARITIGCGKSAPTLAVSKIASPDSPEFLKAQEEANRYNLQKQQEESKQRARRRLPGSDSNVSQPH